MTAPLSRAEAWGSIERRRALATRRGALATKAFFALLVGAVLFAPLHCSTYHVGDYGPKATDSTQSVDQLGLVALALVCAAIAGLRGAALASSLGALRELGALRSLGPPADGAAVETEARYAEQLEGELRGTVVSESVAWLLLALLVLLVALSALR